MPRTGRKTAFTIEFGRRVRERRQQLLLTQETLAHEAGFHPTWVSSLENGERNPSLANVIRLAEHLDVDPGQLISGLHTEPTPG